MGNKYKRYFLLIIGLVLLLATSVTGCAESTTQDDIDAAYDAGYSKGYAAGKAQGYNDGLVEGESVKKEAVDASYDRGYKNGYEDGSGISIEEDYQQYFIQGNGYLTQENWDEAIAKYTKAIELNPEYVEAYIKRAMAYNEKDDFYELAIIDCEKATELDSNVELDSSLARAYLMRGEYNARFVDAASSWDENYKESKNNFDNVVADFTRAIELNERLAEAYKGRADAYVDFNNDRWQEDGDSWGDFETTYGSAIADYNMAIALSPTNAEYYRSRAWAYHLGNDYSRELADDTKAIELDPTNASYYSSRGYTYMDASNYTKAVADFTKAIELGANDYFVYSKRGDAYMELGSYDLAINDYTKAIEVTTYSWSVASLISDRGHAYMKKGEYDKAIVEYTKAIELSTRPSSTYYDYRALAYLEQHNYDLAIADSTKAIELSLEDDDAYWTRGRAYVAIGEKDKALADFRECLSLTEDFEEKYFYETRERNNLVRQEIEKLLSD